jgi:hypothetical protein
MSEENYDARIFSPYSEADEYEPVFPDGYAPFSNLTIQTILPKLKNFVI